VTISGNGLAMTLTIQSVFTNSALEFSTRPKTDFLESPQRLAPAPQPLAAIWHNWKKKVLPRWGQAASTSAT
jgi:hypothetical protein